jgi:hypothetical protein
MPFTPIAVQLVAPNTAEPDTFNDDADKFAADLIPWTSQVNAAGTYINSVGSQVDADKLATADSAADAASSLAASIAVQNIVVSAANFKGNYSALTGALAVPASVYHNGNYWQLLANTSNVTADVPGVSNKWALAANPAGYVAIAAPITLTYAGRYLITNGGTVTIPNPNIFADGVGFVFARAIGFEPTIQTVANGIKWRGGLDDSIALRSNGIALVVASNKYEV